MQLVRRGEAPAFEVALRAPRAGRLLARLPDGGHARRRRGRRAGGVPRLWRSGARYDRAPRLASARGCSASSTTARSTRCAARIVHEQRRASDEGIEERFEAGERTDVEAARREEARDGPRARSTHLPAGAEPGDRARLLRRLHPHGDRRRCSRRRSARSRAGCGSGCEKMRHALRRGAGEPGMSTHGRTLGRRAGAYVLGALAPTRSSGFEAHLAGCADCRRDGRRAAASPPTRCRSAVPQVAPPPALKGRIMAVVEAEAELLAAAGRAARTGRRPRAGAAARGAGAAGGRARASRSPRVAARCSPAARSRAGCSRRRGRRARSPRTTAAAGRRRRRCEVRGRRRDARRPRHAAAARGPRSTRSGSSARARTRSRPTRCGRVNARRATPRSRCRARSTASRRCWSPTSRTGGSQAPTGDAGDHSAVARLSGR